MHTCTYITIRNYHIHGVLQNNHKMKVPKLMVNAILNIFFWTFHFYFSSSAIDNKISKSALKKHYDTNEIIN